jgi:hypothetical protein
MSGTGALGMVSTDKSALGAIPACNLALHEDVSLVPSSVTTEFSGPPRIFTRQLMEHILYVQFYSMWN